MYIYYNYEKNRSNNFDTSNKKQKNTKRKKTKQFIWKFLFLEIFMYKKKG